MNRIITLWLFLSLACKVYSQETNGVHFQKGHTAALELAKLEDKLVFLYFHVPNCEPCDRLARKFKNKSISKLYNKHYISFALDATGEGKKMAEKYGVISFPTLLYLTPKGEIKYSARGYRDGKSIFEIGKRARHPDRIIRRRMESRYKADPKDTDHLYDYIEYLFVRAKYNKANKLLKAYFDQKDSIEKASWMNLVLDFASDPQSCANKVLIDEKDEFIKEFDKGYINEIIWNSLINKVGQKYSNMRVAYFEQKFIEEIIEAGYDPEDDGLILFYSEFLLSSAVFRETGMSSADMTVFTKYALAALDVEDHIFNQEHLITLGSHLITFYQKEESLIKLCEVLEFNFEKEPQYTYPDLQSVALYLLGKEDEAVNKIVAARELALSQGHTHFKPSIRVFKKLGIVK